MRKLALLILLAGLAAGAAHGQSADLNGKKLIEFGWDEPGTAFLRAHIAEMERTPFDGCVFHVDYQKADGDKGSFTWKSWGSQVFTEADLQGAFNDARAVRLGRFKSNFLRFNTTPAKLDWFDDYTAVVANAKLAARLARVAHCPGILFDTEQYEGPLFNYRKQRDAKTKSWELYAAQARQRGREVMRAFHEGYPGLTLFLTFGYSLPWAETANGSRPLADCEYGLMAPFLDGMLEAAQGRERIVDGYEISYGYKTAAQFADGRKVMRQDVLPIVLDPAKYQRVFSPGFGLWLDFDWRKRGWDAADPSRNYFPPDVFASSVQEALREADEYVWIYSETPRWWSDGGVPVKLPDAYEAALRTARENFRKMPSK
jgi:hypothetical protein